MTPRLLTVTDDLRQWLELLRPLWHILLVCLLAWLLLRAIRRLLLAFRARVARRTDERRDGRRLETLINVFRNTATLAIVSVTGMVVLGALGFTITPLLATAGVAGIAIGFGAQSLVKDFFTGLFLLVENQVSEGDDVEVAGKTGRVEQVTLRHIRLRDYDGSVHYIPNGMITVVTNHSREYSYSVIDFNLARSHDFDRLCAAMRAVGAEMRADPLLGPMILAGIEIAGIEKLDEGNMTIRCRLQVAPSRQWRIRGEFLRRMKARIDEPTPS